MEYQCVQCAREFVSEDHLNFHNATGCGFPAPHGPDFSYQQTYYPVFEIPPSQVQFSDFATPIEPPPRKEPIQKSYCRKCADCQKTFFSPKYYADHIANGCLICEHCQFTAKKKKELIFHQSFACFMTPLKCFFCSETFATSQLLEAHKATRCHASKFICGGCGFNSLSRTGFYNHQKICLNCFPCETCMKVFERHDQFTVHKSEGCPGIQHLCAGCGKESTTQRALTAHQKRCGFCFHCPNCHDVFYNRELYKTHQANCFVKRDDADYHPCTKCGKVLRTRTALMSHEKMHENEMNNNIYCRFCRLIDDHKKSKKGPKVRSETMKMKMTGKEVPVFVEYPEDEKFKSKRRSFKNELRLQLHILHFHSARLQDEQLQQQKEQQDMKTTARLDSNVDEVYNDKQALNAPSEEAEQMTTMQDEEEDPNPILSNGQRMNDFFPEFAD